MFSKVGTQELSGSRMLRRSFISQLMQLPELIVAGLNYRQNENKSQKRKYSKKSANEMIVI
jgi:hypothetical protein